MSFPVPTTSIDSLRAALATAPLLGFEARGVGAPRAKAAFVGFNQDIVVTSSDDSGAGTLRSAIAEDATDVASGNGEDEITFAPSLAGGNTINLSSPLTISSNVVIDGGSNNITVSGQNNVGDFNVNAPGSVAEIDNLTIANGSSTGAAGTAGAGTSASTVNGGAGGDAAGGIFVQNGSLSVSNDTFTNDTATGGTGGNGSTYFSPGIGASTKGAGGAGGNAAGAIYVEPGASITASGLKAYNTTGTGGAGGTSPIGPTSAAGTGSPVSNSSTVNSHTVTCFVTGTRILTARGEVAVENLVVGDLAVTASGAHRPVRWIGHRTLDCSRHPRPNEVLPIRIAADAFGPDRPKRDLFVSPGHSIAVTVLDDVLIIASALVNGATIAQQQVERVTYWHVELDSHDVLLAENLGAESYLDMGNRAFFADGGVVALGASPDADPAQRTHADFCRPFHDGGPVVEAVRGRLNARVRALGWTLDSEDLGGLHLLVDERRVEPVVRGLHARFAVPAGAQEVWLVSQAVRPSDIGYSGDERTLGVYLAGLMVDDGFATRGLALDDARLCVGFHDLEGDRRWTAGRALLPAEMWADYPNGVDLRVELFMPALPRWRAPNVVEASHKTVVNAA